MRRRPGAPGCGRVLGGRDVAVCSFGADNAGQARHVGLTICDIGGNVLADRGGRAGVGADSGGILGVDLPGQELSRIPAAGPRGSCRGGGGGGVEPGVTPVPYPNVVAPERPDAPERWP